MNVVLRSNNQAALQLLSRALGLKPTWPVDVRPDFEGPGGFSSTIRVGDGVDVFVATVGRLTSWEMHRQAGLRVWPSAESAELGSEVVLGFEFGPVLMLAPCRIAYLVEEDRRQGFGYVTLPGHPEAGVEEFVVERHDDDSVWASIRAVSRPASLLTRIGGPVGRLVQRRVTGRYLQALATQS
jgi:uncharacterized protein (UPF0548 family)